MKVNKSVPSWAAAGFSASRAFIFFFSLVHWKLLLSENGAVLEVEQTFSISYEAVVCWCVGVGGGVGLYAIRNVSHHHSYNDEYLFLCS